MLHLFLREERYRTVPYRKKGVEYEKKAKQKKDKIAVFM
jgi:hypothetical protein